MLTLMQGCSAEHDRPNALGASCSSPSCGDANRPDSRPDAKDATSEPTDDVVSSETSDDGSNDGEPYDGPTGSVRGSLFLSNPPAFEITRPSEYSLLFPAEVAVWAFGEEYAAAYDPAEGYHLEGIPTGTWTFVVRDIEEKNGLLQSVFERQVQEGLVEWDIPVIGKNSFVVIYGSVSPTVIRDPALAQVILSFESCESQGSKRISGVSVSSPLGGMVLVHDGLGWKYDEGSGTGEYGVAVVANLPAESYPGSKVSMSYTFEGATYPIEPFTVFRGGVIRVVVVHPC
ncbi:MAG TPA: hypothetical protein PLJ27_12000 [Polyangiaceae bacterium]|jgi:hypothetical protein|nr:hypothetical protein [Polyangiaceae bacterium]